jgi:hypothetical protein
MPDTIAGEGSPQELTFQVPLSEVYRFSKPGKAGELAEAHKAGPGKPAAMANSKRFLISTIGIFCLMVGLMGLFGRNPNMFSFLWIVLGAAIIWVFIAKPEMDKRKSGPVSDTSKDPDVTLVFNPGRIVVRSPHNEMEKQWSELIEYRKTKKGIHLYFLDGTAIWLPETVFYDRDEKQELLQMLDKKVQSSKFKVQGEKQENPMA